MKTELPRALRDLQKGNIAPVDLAQAAIGPGMAVFSRFKRVLESDGAPMRVRTALALINQTLDEVLSEQESEFDPDTRWALAWFEQHAFDEGLYGEAEVLATAKALSVSGLAESGILHSRAGKVRLFRREELPEDWNPVMDHRLTVWGVTQHLIRKLDKYGETATSALAEKVGGLAVTARDLAYRLYILSERKGWAEEAGYYNSLVVSWPAIAPKKFVLS
jgi:putative DNA methylase